MRRFAAEDKAKVTWLDCANRDFRKAEVRQTAAQDVFAFFFRIFLLFLLFIHILLRLVVFRKQIINLYVTKRNLVGERETTPDSISDLNKWLFNDPILLTRKDLKIVFL